MTRRAVLTLLAVVAAGSVVFLAASSTADAVVLHGTFVDDNDSVHENGIEAVAAAGITVGCNPPANDRYCPNDDVTRAQAATFVARARDLPSDGKDYFVDDNGHVLEGGINKLAFAEITAGCNPPANDRFCPERPLTRAQFAAFIVRALDIPHSDRDFFRDDDGHVLERAINAIAEEGITVGCNPPANDRFCPNERLSRGQMATLFTRALGLPQNPTRLPLAGWSPISCSKDGIRCSVTIDASAGRYYRVLEGLFQTLPYGPGEQSAFTAGDSRFRLTLDGSPVALTGHGVVTDANQARRMWDTVMVFASGRHTLVGEWYRDGSLVQRTTATLRVD